MFYTWKIFFRGELVATVRSRTAYGAREQYYMKHSNTNPITGIGFDTVKVVKA